MKIEAWDASVQIDGDMTFVKVAVSFLFDNSRRFGVVPCISDKNEQ